MLAFGSLPDGRVSSVPWLNGTGVVGLHRRLGMRWLMNCWTAFGQAFFMLSGPPSTRVALPIFFALIVLFRRMP